MYLGQNEFGQDVCMRMLMLSFACTEFVARMLYVYVGFILAISISLQNMHFNC